MMRSRNQDALDFLRNLVGEEKFIEVASALAGERITFPKYFQWIDKDERNQAIKQDLYEGLDVSELARKYELSESQVYKIVEGQYG